MSPSTSRVLALCVGLLGTPVLTSACSPGGSGSGARAGDVGEGAAEASGAASTEGIAPGADAADQALSASPRHGEWVMIPVGGTDSVRAWVVHPERADAAPVVVVLHEIFGLTTWVRSIADGLAAEGFLAVAPDLLTGLGVPRTESGEPERDPAVAAVRSLDAGQVHRRIRSVAEWAMDRPSATDRYAVMGFCWGGSTTFAHATRFEDLDAAVVYYGSSPEPEALHRVVAPVLGLYGGDDARVNATIPRADSILSERGRTFEAHVYEGAGHGFLRQQDGREGANRRASEQAWPETVAFLRATLERAR